MQQSTGQHSAGCTSRAPALYRWETAVSTLVGVDNEGIGVSQQP
jgi:hypothetical protein